MVMVHCDYEPKFLEETPLSERGHYTEYVYLVWQVLGSVYLVSWWGKY